MLAVTRDPQLRIDARLHIGWALIWSNQHADALATLISVAQEASARLPGIAWQAIGQAGTVAYQTGTAEGRHAVRDTLDHMQEPAPPAADWPAGLAARVPDVDKSSYGPVRQQG